MRPTLGISKGSRRLARKGGSRLACGPPARVWTLRVVPCQTCGIGRGLRQATCALPIGGAGVRGGMIRHSALHRQQEQALNLEHILQSVVEVHSSIPEDGFTAGILGTERAGSGVVIRENGLVLTIGYLITEAEGVWLTSADGRVIPAHALA